MKLNYLKVESTENPDEVFFDGVGVFLRRNITEDEREQADGSKTLYFVYEEVRLSLTEFQVYCYLQLLRNAEMGV